MQPGGCVAGTQRVFYTALKRSRIRDRGIKSPRPIAAFMASPPSSLSWRHNRALVSRRSRASANEPGPARTCRLR